MKKNRDFFLASEEGEGLSPFLSEVNFEEEGGAKIVNKEKVESPYLDTNLAGFQKAETDYKLTQSFQQSGLIGDNDEKYQHFEHFENDLYDKEWPTEDAIFEETNFFIDFNEEEAPGSSMRPTPEEILNTWKQVYRKFGKKDCGFMVKQVRAKLIKGRNCSSKYYYQNAYTDFKANCIITNNNELNDAYSRGWGKKYMEKMENNLKPRFDHIIEYNGKYYMKIYSGEYVSNESMQPSTFVELKPGMEIYTAEGATYYEKPPRWLNKHMVTYYKDGQVLEATTDPNQTNVYRNFINTNPKENQPGQYSITVYSDIDRRKIATSQGSMNNHLPNNWEDIKKMSGDKRPSMFLVVLFIYDPYYECSEMPNNNANFNSKNIELPENSQNKAGDAILKNYFYAHKLGWESERQKINILLGFFDISPSAELFVAAVADWQRNNGFSEKNVDGVIGPMTWEKMKQMLNGSAQNHAQTNTNWLGLPLKPSDNTQTNSSSLKTIINPVVLQWVQNSLNRILEIDLSTDGAYGNKTKAALQDFQNKAKISAHGNIDALTIDEIEKNMAHLPLPIDTTNVRFIKWVQMTLNLIYFRPPSSSCRLNILGSGGLEVDGDFGKNLINAIKEFQKKYPAELSATGALDSNTINKLTLIAAKRPARIDGSLLNIEVPTYDGVDWVGDHFNGNDIPVSFLKAWISKEAGGKMASWTRQLDERGYMQLHPEESATLCIDHLRLSWDWSYSFSQGILYIQQYMKVVDNLGFKREEELYWRLVKLCHWTSGGVRRVVKYMEANGFEPQYKSWGEFKSFIQNNYKEVRREAGIDPNIGLDNVDKTFVEAIKFGFDK